MFKTYVGLKESGTERIEVLIFTPIEVAKSVCF